VLVKYIFAAVGAAAWVRGAWMGAAPVDRRGRNEPRTPSITFFEDPVPHPPQTPARFGRPYPAYTNITMTTSTGKSAYDGLQMGFNGRTRRLTLGATYILSRTLDNHNGNRGGTPTNWFNLD